MGGCRSIGRGDLSPYTGTFSFDYRQLQGSLKRWNSNYNNLDPRTWPIIELNMLRAYLGHDYTGEQALPPHVAYTPDTMMLYLKHQSRTRIPQSQAGVDQQDPANRIALFPLNYQYWPLNYDKSGQERNKFGMSGNEYSAWRRGMAGSKTTASKSTSKMTQAHNQNHLHLNEVKELNGRLDRAQNEFRSVQEELKSTLQNRNDELATKEHELLNLRNLLQQRDNDLAAREKNIEDMRMLIGRRNVELAKEKEKSNRREQMRGGIQAFLQAHDAESAADQEVDQNEAHPESASLRNNKRPAVPVDSNHAAKRTRSGTLSNDKLSIKQEPDSEQ